MMGFAGGLRTFGAVFLCVVLAGCGTSAAPPSAPTAAPQASAAAPQASAAAPAAVASPASPVGAGVPSPSPAGNLIKMTSAYSAVSVSQLPVMVAKDMGFFEKNGLDVDLQYIATAENAAAAVLSGQVQIVLNTQDALISADLHGADLVLIAAGTGKLIFSFDSVPSVTKVEELKGKRIGVTKVGSATDVAARYVLGQHGLQPNDVTIVGVGGVPEILSALTAGAIDAGMLSPPTSFGAPAAGLRELVDFTKLDFQYYAGGVTARRSWLQANPDTAVRYLRAFNEAVQLIHTDSGKAEQVLAKYTKQNDPAILHDSLALLQNGISEDQHPLPATLKSTLDELSQTDPAAKSARPEQFIDTTYLDKALAQP